MNIKDIKNLAHICAFEGEFAVFKTQKGKEGIVNRMGEIVLEAGKYEFVFREMDNSIYTVGNGDGSPMQYFDAVNRKIVELTTLEIYRAKKWNENIVCIKGEHGKGAINLTTGKTVIPFQNAIVSYKKQFHVILVMDFEEKYGLFDEDGNTILPMEYRYINVSNDRGLDEIAVKKDGECYFINAKQEKVNVF